MILGIEDIFGGKTILAIMTWVGLTSLFYLVIYMAALQVMDDFTRNNYAKIPAMVGLSIPAAFFMAIFNYNPNILFVLMAISNYFRVKTLASPDNKKFQNIQINKPLFYTASYLYIVAIFFLSSYLIYPTEFNGQTVPLWQTWLPPTE